MIGQHLLLHNRTNASLNYNAHAHVVTDHCQSAIDLFNQRRRWINGTFACRIYSARQMKSYVCAHHLSITRRCLVLWAIVWSILQLVAQLLMPLSLALVTGVATLILVQHLSGNYHRLAAWAGVVIFLSQWLMVLYESYVCDRSTWRLRRRALVLLAGLSIQITLSSCILIAIAPLWSRLICLMALLSVIVVISATKGIRALLPTQMLFLYLPASLSINLYLTTYAFTNFSNVSWGTKGLVLRPEQGRREGEAMQSVLLGLWVISTGFLSIGLLVSFGAENMGKILHVIVAFFMLRIVAGALLVAVDSARR
jgi:cellulose synthase/poly-beta-1,6-N-acetylglucosamine synthase-like glycosyltransferase